jgi:hypothetical protein
MPLEKIALDRNAEESRDDTCRHSVPATILIDLKWSPSFVKAWRNTDHPAGRRTFAAWGALLSGFESTICK